MSENALWELMELCAKERYYIDNAQLPGIIIATGPFVAPDAKRYEFFTVYFGRGIAHWNFKNLSLAQSKVKEILGTAIKPIQIRVERS